MVNNTLSLVIEFTGVCDSIISRILVCKNGKMGKCITAFNICYCPPTTPPLPHPSSFLAPEEVLSFKLKYWANLFKLINFLVFILLFTFSLPCRKDQFAVLHFIQHVIVLIQVYNWEILHHRTQRFVAVDLLIFHILEGCPQVRKKLLSLVP